MILACGGGFFPYQIGRLDHGWRSRPALRRQLPHPPSHYLRDVICDSLVHDPASLRFPIERISWGHVVLSCDYPFGMGTNAPVGAVRALQLPPEQEAAILGGTLAALLRIEFRPQRMPEAP